MKNKKLILVSANRHKEPYPVYPLGLSYLKTYLALNRPDIDIKVFDFITGSYDDYVNLLREMSPDLIGISFRNIDDVNIYKKESFINHYRKIITLSRENCNAVVIIGGSGFSIYPKLLFETLEPDYGIYGEGEKSLIDLISCIEGKSSVDKVEGLVFRNEVGVVVNKRGIPNLSPVLSFDDSLTDYYWQHSGMLNIQTKRGCPYNCIYCTYPIIEGHKVRTLEPGEIVKTLTELYETKKIDYVFFTDSIFNISNSFNFELADRLISSGLNINWGGYFNFSNIDRKLLEKMKLAGLKHIEFGTDTISESLLARYEKPFSVGEILRVCEYCNELDIDFAHFLILGGYGENEDTLNETFANSKKIRRTVFFPFIGMRIYPGTKLHSIAVSEGIVNPDDPILEPVYYVSKDIDLNSLKQSAKNTGQSWVFPDDDLGVIMTRMRQRNKKGPLWEYLIR